jgi:hypothetical protein
VDEQSFHSHLAEAQKECETIHNHDVDERGEWVPLAHRRLYVELVREAPMGAYPAGGALQAGQHKVNKRRWKVEPLK